MSTKSFYGIGQGSFYGGGMYGSGQSSTEAIEKELGPASIVSFNDSLKNKPLKECVVNIEPVQDLNGYDNPWPAGGGKNILDPNIVMSAETIDGVALTTKNGYQVHITGTASGSNAAIFRSNLRSFGNDIVPLPAGTYTLSSNFTAQIRNVVDGNFLKNVTNTFTADVEFYICQVWTIVSVGQTVDTDRFISLLKGSSTPVQWTPYVNICPITGHTSTKVTRIGKNLLDHETAMSAVGFVKQGDEWFLETARVVLNKTLWENTSGVNGSITLTYSYKYNSTSLQGARFVFWYSDGTHVDNSAFSSTTYRTKAITSDAQKTLLKISFTYGTASVSTWIKDIQIELGSTATDYEPYTGETYSVEFPSEAGTVYGGTLDVTSGVLTVDRGYKRFDGTEVWLDGSVGTTGHTYFFYKIGAANSGVNDSGVCSHFPASDVRGATTDIGQRVVNSTAMELRLCVRPNNFESYTPATFKAWVAEQTQNGTPLEIMWELAVPQIYQLTPMQIRALAGENNIWADTGNITIKYLAKK